MLSLTRSDGCQRPSFVRTTLAALALVVGLLSGLVILPRVFARGETAMVGRKAPDFSLSLVANGASLGGDGAALRIGQLRGRAVVLDFLGHVVRSVSSRGSHRRRDLASMARSRRRRRWGRHGYGRSGRPEGVRAASHGLSYPMVHDLSGEASRLYGIESLPTLVVLSRTGTVIAVRTGVTDDREIERAFWAKLWTRACSRSPAARASRSASGGRWPSGCQPRCWRRTRTASGRTSSLRRVDRTRRCALRASTRPSKRSARPHRDRAWRRCKRSGRATQSPQAGRRSRDDGGCRETRRAHRATRRTAAVRVRVPPPPVVARRRSAILIVRFASPTKSNWPDGLVNGSSVLISSAPHPTIIGAALFPWRRCRENLGEPHGHGFAPEARRPRCGPARAGTRGVRQWAPTLLARPAVAGTSPAATRRSVGFARAVWSEQHAATSPGRTRNVTSESAWVERASAYRTGHAWSRSTLGLERKADRGLAVQRPAWPGSESAFWMPPSRSLTCDSTQ